MPWLMNPLVLRIVGAGLAVAAVLIGWNMLTGHYEQVGYQRAVAEYNDKARAAEVASRLREQQILNQVRKAEYDSAAREKALRAEFAALQRSNLGLRNTVATLRASLPALAADACRQTADAALAVFGDCTARLGEMAQDADGHENDVRTLMEAWPKCVKPCC